MSEFVTRKELSEALLAIGEALVQQDERLAQLEASVLAVKGFLAPANPRSEPLLRRRKSSGS